MLSTSTMALQATQRVCRHRPFGHLLSCRQSPEALEHEGDVLLRFPALHVPIQVGQALRHALHGRTDFLSASLPISLANVSFEGPQHVHLRQLVPFRVPTALLYTERPVRPLHECTLPQIRRHSSGHLRCNILASIQRSRQRGTAMLPKHA